jgi:hypothetical protein
MYDENAPKLAGMGYFPIPVAPANITYVAKKSPVVFIRGALLNNATRICEATSGLLVRAENDGFLQIVASVRQRADTEEMKHRTFKFGPSSQTAGSYGRGRSCTCRTSLKIRLI